MEAGPCGCGGGAPWYGGGALRVGRWGPGVWRRGPVSGEAGPRGLRTGPLVMSAQDLGLFWLRRAHTILPLRAASPEDRPSRGGSLQTLVSASPTFSLKSLAQNLLLNNTR